MNVEEILHRLEREYGVRRWQPNGNPISVLIGTILSQNTSDVNSKRAFESLLTTFSSWERVADAGVENISRAIKSGGLANIKARRIKEVLLKIEERRDSLDLSFLKEFPLPEAKAWLEQLPGVGPKTAACVLLFGLGRPAMPVDTHVFRVANRLGLINSNTSPREAQELLESQLPPPYIYQLHLHLIEHGRKVCRARQPRCPECVLWEGCPAGGY